MCEQVRNKGNEPNLGKPEYLYHGSRQKTVRLEPAQGIGHGEADNEYGIYAVSERDLAVPFAITYYPLSPRAVFSVDTSQRPPRIVLRDTEVSWHEKGYIYTLRSETFEQTDALQWVSRVPVEPVLIEEITPELYRDWVVDS